MLFLGHQNKWKSIAQTFGFQRRAKGSSGPVCEPIILITRIIRNTTALLPDDWYTQLAIMGYHLVVVADRLIVQVTVRRRAWKAVRSFLRDSQRSKLPHYKLHYSWHAVLAKWHSLRGYWSGASGRHSASAFRLGIQICHIIPNIPNKSIPSF